MTDAAPSPDLATGLPTRWSQVRLAARAEPGPEVEAAWRYLLARYGDQVRRSLALRLPGVDPADAAGDFFAHLFENRLLQRADPERGRFRCYVSGIASRFALSQRHGAVRGAELPEDDGLPDVREALSVEAADEAQWAEGYLSRALERLLEQHPRDGELIVRSLGLLGRAPESVEEMCATSGLKRNALYQALHRARRRARELLREEVADTAAGGAELDEELAMVEERLLAARPGLFEGADIAAES